MICDILKNLREEKGLSRQQVADMLGVSKRTIESYEYGNREPNIEMICKFADFYEVSVDYLFGRTCSAESIITEKEKELLTAYKNSNMKNAIDILLKSSSQSESTETTQSENQASQNSEPKLGGELGGTSNPTIGGRLITCLSNIKEKLSCVISTNKNFSNIKKDLSDIVSAYKNPKQIKKPSVLCKDQRGLINYACSVLCFTLIHAFLLHFGCYSIALAVPVMNNTLSGLYHFSRSKRFKSIIWDILLILPHFIFGTILIVSQNESAILIAKIFEYLVTDLFVLYNALDDDMSKS